MDYRVNRRDPEALPVQRIDDATGHPITDAEWAAFDWEDVTTFDSTRPLGSRVYLRGRPRAGRQPLPELPELSE